MPFPNDFKEIREDCIIGREGAMYAANTIICGRSFADITSALRNWEREQLSPEFSQLPELDFAACFWAHFSVNHVQEAAFRFVVWRKKVC